MNNIITPKVFISYSWSSQEHYELIRSYGEHLADYGIDVVLDQWSLSEGQDKYAFMEKMVTDPNITHVLIFSDSQYAEKATRRTAGVGTESQIISKEVYDKIEQKKFIPIVCEKDSDGQPFLPVFLKSRKWIDFSTQKLVSDNWERLIRVLYCKPIVVKPALGKVPHFLNVNTRPTLPFVRCKGEQCENVITWTMLRQCPFVVYTNFNDYAKFVETISRSAKNFLLWTMNASPIKVNKKLIDKNSFLTEYDNAFKELKAKKKIRIVIFSDFIEAEEYIKDASTRKLKFEECHDPNENTILLFTIRNLLAGLNLAKSNSGIFKEPPDMGCVLTSDNYSEGLIFHSEFQTDDLPSDSRIYKDTLFYPFGFEKAHPKDRRKNFLTFHKEIIKHLFKNYNNGSEPERVYVQYAFRKNELEKMCEKSKALAKK